MKEDLKTIVKRAAVNNGSLIMVSHVGSKLYGTESAASDRDYAGVYVPTRYGLYTNEFPATITFKEGDLDVQLHSIYHFKQMVINGDSKAIEMLNVPYEMLIVNTLRWEVLRMWKERLLSKKVFNFVRFANSQAVKYGVKGERYNALRDVSDVLKSNIGYTNTDKTTTCPVRMKGIWEEIPRNKFVYDIADSPNGVRQLNVCGKIIQETVAIDYALAVVTKPLNEYGERAKNAAAMEGADWKALSHAYKVGAFIVDLCSYHKLEFPLPYAGLLSDIKYGRLPIEIVMDCLEKIIDKAKYLQQISNWDAEVDVDFLNKLILDIIEMTLNPD